MISTSRLATSRVMAQHSPREAATPAPAPDLLSLPQLIKAGLLGIVLWFVAAVSYRLGFEQGLFTGGALALNYLAGIPICWLSVQLVKWGASLQPSQVLPGLAFSTALAAFCDGIALAWYRDLYGHSPAAVLPGAAWILWGVGWILALAYLEGARRHEP